MITNPKWTFRCYQDLGLDIIDSWFEECLNEDWRETARARLDTIMRYLAQQPHSYWNKNDYFKPLHGSAAGIGEIRFEVKNIACRALGFFSAGMEFTFVVMTTKKGRKYDPKNALELAVNRRVEVEVDRSKSHEHEFD